MVEEHYAAIFRSVLAGRKWIVPADAAAGATRTVAWLREHGAPAPFVIAGATGTGPLPDIPGENIVLLETSGSSMMGAIHGFLAAVHAPLPGRVRQRLDAWDPGGEARVFANFLDVDLPIGGREQFGARPVPWRDLEDKTVIDALWDEAGIDRAPRQLIGLTRGEVAQALTALDRGSGIVVTGDNRQGWHGGAEYTRVVRTAADIAGLLEFLGPRCDEARAMPYLEGIPCSIHGLVFPDHILTVRPVEMMVFYEPAQRRFRYGSAAATWEPPPADTDYMREVAARFGAYLRATLQYRGAFTIDGVLTRTGFLPTELNPRAGAGLRVVTTEEPNAFAISKLLIAGVDADWEPRRLEAYWRARSRDPRGGRGYTVVEQTVTGNESIPVGYENGAWSPSGDEDADGSLTRGPAAAGGLVLIEFAAGVVRPGDSAAPVVAAGFALADELWGTNIGELVPAAAVRPPPGH